MLMLHMHAAEAEAQPKVVEERLGHSSTSVTMDIYSHLTPNMQEGTPATVDEALRAAINKHAEDVR
jgi:integrase